MLIKALADYYDILAEKGAVLPDGYSTVAIKYKIPLKSDGTIGDIIDCQQSVEITQKNGKLKEKRIPKEMIFPQRTEKSGIDANIAEHRALYIFGLNFEEERFTPDDRTGKARKSHAAFKEKNLSFIEGLHSPMIDAYRAFLQNWNPEEETQNQSLLQLGKAYSGAGFAFSLAGSPDVMLHEDSVLKEKWERIFRQADDDAEGKVIAQCAVSGKQTEIARIHSKIKGVYGGLATGKPGTDDPSKPGDSDKPGTGKPGTGLPQTGDPAMIAAAGTGLIGSMAAAIGAFFHRRRRDQ